MADYYESWIEIPIRYHSKAFEDEVRKDSSSGDIDDITKNEGVVRLTVFEARWGQLENAENWCKNNSVPYNRWTSDDTEGCYMECYRPNEEVKTFDTTPEGDPFVTTEPLTKLLNSIFDEELDREQTIEQLNTLLCNNSDAGLTCLSAYNFAVHKDDKK